jgi:predicted Zn-dependent protease
MQREIEQQQKGGHNEQAARYAALAAGLAEQLNKWAAQHPQALTPEQRYAVRYRLARAVLQAGQAERALGVFEELYKEDAARNGGTAKDGGVLEGRAACMYSLGKWMDARQAYLDIWRRATPRSDMWWQSIFRSLQCAAQIRDEDPSKILKVIRQHKDLYPDMGGPALAKQFDELSFEMLKRIEAAQASQPAAKK